VIDGLRLTFHLAGINNQNFLMGVTAFGANRAFRYDALLRGKLVLDHVGMEPVIVVVGPDNVSVRLFRQRIPGVDAAPDFYRVEGQPALFLDSTTGSGWNFQGCAISGKLQGKCLEPVETVKDYWFDWRNYHPDTTIFAGTAR